MDCTCTTTGSDIYQCTRCGDEYTKEFSARHSDSDNDGFCDFCGEPYVGVLDLVFVIDTTGSMGSEISVVKNNIANYAKKLDNSNIPYYIAIVDYRDFADRAYSYDYPYSVIQDFSDNIDTILTGVNKLSLGNGGDTNETVYSGLMTGLDELHWGEKSVKKVILIGDAPPLDPEPYTNFELNGVCDSLNEKGVSVYTVATGGSSISKFTSIATNTGGISYVCSTDSQFNQVLVDIIDSVPETLHIHTYDENVTEATCTQSGHVVYTCTGCGKVISSDIDPLGHEPSEEWTVDTEPTCVLAGSKSHHCTRCDAKLDVTEIPALGHEPSDEWTVDTEPTCVLAGSKSRHCTRCDVKLDVTEIPALGHDMPEEWTVDIEPTCLVAGSEHKTCNRCDYTDVQEIPALGHVWTNDYKVTLEPTCTQVGYESKWCTVCGAFFVILPVIPNRLTDTQTVRLIPIPSGRKALPS